MRSITVLTVAAIILCLILFLNTYFLKRSQKYISNGGFIFFLFSISFIIHPLGFLLYVSTNWNMVNDGQFVFAIFGPFAYTSFFYSIIGLVIEIIRKLTKDNSLKNSIEQTFSNNTNNQLDTYMTTELITTYMTQYKSKPSEELMNIIVNKGWQNEAKIAAQRIIDERKTLPNT